ncbi:putative aspartate kinase [Helianthus anomalus]
MLQGDILFMRMSKDPIRVGDILSFIVDFGGSSVLSVDTMKEVVELILSFPEENLVIVLSAMGKTTNKLIAAREKAASYISDVSEIDKLSFVKELNNMTVDELGLDRSIIIVELPLFTII